MGVTLYKAGSTRTVRGIECEFQTFDEMSYLHMLTMGWFYSPEECYEIEEPEEKQFFDSDGILEVSIEEETKPELSEKEIRADAKSKKIRNWHNKKIDNLKAEIDAWQPEI